MKIFTPNTIISSSDMNLNFGIDNLTSAISSKGAKYIWLNGIMICWGSDLMGSPASAGTIVTFPVAFDVAPYVNMTVTDTNGWIPYILGANTTTFTGKQSYTGSSLACNWIAVGVRAVKP